MDNLEVILVDFKKSALDTLIFAELEIKSSQVIRSHFFDKNQNRDVEFQQINSFQKILTPNGTGNVFLRELNMGYTMKDVMVVFSFDDIYGDIVFNFPESGLFTEDSNTTTIAAKQVIEFFIRIKEKFDIPNVKIGIEPASDDDTCLIELNENFIDIDTATKKLLNVN
ncbi:hypothetical protein [Halalkalibacterium halodurans]|uniref:Uncharacterized protein n=1 Tax=Halalkalibacterium halodurans TaxID=86665 RepID=A0A0M0KNQ1_ALKHA|nr:hypothetical protein [Halalkalibacterium halodurans]TPE68203.1 hypothetical protein AMD02_014645 [Halalkalibacterium halodurans]